MTSREPARENARFSKGTAALHWLMAALILLLYALGWYMVGIERQTPARGLFFNIHKSFGLLAMVAIALFCIGRLRRRAPPYPASMARWERIAAVWVHALTYVLLLIVPLAGYAEANFNEWGITVFGLVHLPPWGPDNAHWRELLNTIHVYSANLFAAVIAVHIAAALKHALWDHDRVLQRMLPWI